MGLVVNFVGFSVIYVLQGSVATYVRCGGISTRLLQQISRWVCQWKNFQNR